VAPAFRAAAVAPIDALKDEGRGSTGDGGRHLSGGLIVAQVALSVVIVAAAGLFVRTFRNLATLPIGIERGHVLVATVNFSRTHVKADERPAVLERLDTILGDLRAAGERLAPGRTWMAVVSDHGFARAEQQLNLFSAFQNAGLLKVERGRIREWTAVPWNSGGSTAIVLKDPGDDATRARVRDVLAKLAGDPAHGIDRVLEADALHARGGFPTAAFVVGLKPGWQLASGVTGGLVTKSRGGQHGHLPDVPDLHASFFVIGPGVPAGRSLGLIDMRDIAPTLAHRTGLTLLSADGKNLLP